MPPLAFVSDIRSDGPTPPLRSLTPAAPTASVRLQPFHSPPAFLIESVKCHIHKMFCIIREYSTEDFLALRKSSL